MECMDQNVWNEIYVMECMKRNVWNGMDYKYEMNWRSLTTEIDRTE